MSPSDRPGQVGISVQSLSKRFGPITVFQDIDITVRPGEFVCLLGPSGCGKTTLLRCVAGLERPDTGRIAIGDRTVVDEARGIFVPPERRQLGMVFQHYALWPHMTVEQNILYPLRKRGVPIAQRTTRLRQVMQTVGLPPLHERRPAQLSGGQQQRVALARALISEPPVLLLDEPQSNLDATLRRQWRRELRQLHERLGTTTVLVTHDQEEAAAVADTVAVMHHGRIIQAGVAADVFERPRTRFVAEFVGFDNFVAGRLEGTGPNGALVRLTSGQLLTMPGPTQCTTVGGEVLIAARSERVSVRPLNEMSAVDQGIAGTVRHCAPIGHQLEMEVVIGDQVVIVRDDIAKSRRQMEPGSKVRLDFAPGHCFLIAVTNVGGQPADVACPER